MISLYENGLWERKTLRQLKAQFPQVSFRKSSEQDGATWSFGDVDYEAKLVIEVVRPLPTQGFQVVEGPLEDFQGTPRQTWTSEAIPAPSSDPDDYPLDGVKFRELLFSGAREGEMQTLIAGLGENAKGKARAYMEGSRFFNWSDPQIQTLIGALSETEITFSDAWVAKGRE